MYRAIAKKVFWEFDSITVQNLSDILPLFCAPTWPSRHVSKSQEFPISSSVIEFIHLIVFICRAVGGNAEAPFVHIMGEEVRLILLP